MMGPRVVLVVGERNSGKTAYVRNAVARARRRGLTVAGFYSEAEWVDGIKARFHLQDVAEPRRRWLLASTMPGRGLDQRVGQYHLSGEAFQAAETVLRETDAADVVVLDEVGPLELRGGGFMPTLRHLLETHTGILLLTARPSVAPGIRHLVEASRPEEVVAP